jgi:hypothetical protein
MPERSVLAYLKGRSIRNLTDFEEIFCYLVFFKTSGIYPVLVLGKANKGVCVE